MTACSHRTAPAALFLSLGLALAPLHVAAQPAATTPTPASVSTSTSTTTPADDKAATLKRAEELYLNGKRLYNDGSYEAAILAFQESYELSKLPQLLYNIGNTYERLGDFANARRYLDQYRAFAPESEREVLSRRISALDQRQREKEQKEREAAAAAANSRQPTQPPPQTEPKPVTQPEQAPPKKDRIYGPAAIGLTAGVVVGLGLGAGFGIKASGEKKQALEGCMRTDGGTLLCSDASQAALDKRKTSALVADIGFIVGGVAAAALIGVIVAKAMKKSKTSTTARAQVMPYANQRGGGLGFSFRF